MVLFCVCIFAPEGRGRGIGILNNISSALYKDKSITNLDCNVIVWGLIKVNS